MRILLPAFCLFAAIAAPLFAQEVKAPTKLGAVIEVEICLAEWKADDGAASLTGDGGELAERIDKLEKSGKLTVAKRMRLTAVEDVATTVQIGDRRPRVVGSQVSARGTTNQVAYESIGTLLRITPTVIDDKLALALTFEQSAPRGKEDGPVLSEQPGGEKIRAESIGTLMVTTTVSLKSGQTVVVGGVSEGPLRQVLLVTAKRSP